MILFPKGTKPEVKTREELMEIWDGTAILISKKGVMDREAIFSFKWFIPTILKFKREFILVLIAVFTVQILGILTPVMTSMLPPLKIETIFLSLTSICLIAATVRSPEFSTTIL